MHDVPAVALVPRGLVVLDRVIADREDQVCGIQQPVGGLVVEQTDAAGK